MSKLSAKKLGQFFAKLYCLYILEICRDTSVNCNEDHKNRQTAHGGMFPPAA